MKVETRNTIPVGRPAAASADEPSHQTQVGGVVVSETVYIAEGDSVAVVRLGNVPFIIPVRSKNERSKTRAGSSNAERDARSTMRVPAPPYETPTLLTLELAEDAPRPLGAPNVRRSPFAQTIAPPRPPGDNRGDHT